MWPGVRVGHRTVLDTGDEAFGRTTLTTLSLWPRAFSVEPLLTAGEAEAIQTEAEPSMMRSECSNGRLRPCCRD